MTTSESEFSARAEATLAAIERAVDAVAIDAEVERAGAVLTIELADGSRIVVNTQAPLQQIWVAARSGGFHFAWKDEAWRNTRDGEELFKSLSAIVSKQGGAPVVLRER